MGVKAGSKRTRLRERIAKKPGRRLELSKRPSEALLVRLLRRLLESSRRRKFYPFGCLFYYSPLEILESGTFVVASAQRRAVFFGLTTLYAAILVYRLHILIGYLTHNGLDLIGVLSCMYVLAMFVAACLYYGVLFAYEDLRPLLNRSHVHCMRQVCGLEDGPFNDLSFWLKRACVSGVVSTAVLETSLSSLLFNSIPVCVYPMVKGILPNLSLSPFAWQVVLYPVEVLSFGPLFMPVLISVITVLIGGTHMKEYVKKLSKKAILNSEDWEEVEREYRCALVYNKILVVWFRRMATPGVVALMFAMIGLAYVTLTSFQRLPFIIYALFPSSFVAVTGMFTLVCLDAVVTKMFADNVIVSLRARSGFFRRLSREEKKEFLLRCRALRPISLPIGNFTELTLNVPIYVFEEVLNQLLFLLAF